MAVRIIGVGKYLPSRVLTNHDLEAMVETSDDWIVERTGIHERRIAADTENVASLGANAARMALQTAGLDAADIDLIVCSTCTADVMPPAASLIQASIGATGAAAFDVNAACTGFLAAYSIASSFLESSVYRRVLVVGSDVFSRILDWHDRATCVLFGDGAGAVVLERVAASTPRPVVLKSDGAGASYLYAHGPGSAPASLSETAGFCVVMDGREVFRFAVKSMEDVARQAVQAASLCLDDVSVVLPHQANQRILTAMMKGLGLPPERLYSNVARYGNTSAASIPVALCEAWEEGRLTPGDRLLFVAVGAGLTWGATVADWTGVAGAASPQPSAIS